MRILASLQLPGGDLVQGVHPKVVADMLGHAKVGLTLDVYSHVLPSLQVEAVGKIEALLASEG